MRRDTANEFGGAQPKDVLDLACSIGFGTFLLQQTFPTSRITGIDLSSYMLAFAEYKAETDGSFRIVAECEIGKGLGTGRIISASAKKAPQFLHGLIEESPFDNNSFDMLLFNTDVT